MDQVTQKLLELSPTDADPTEIATEIARVVDTPKGQRPFRVSIDPANDGAAVVYAVGDQVRRECYGRIGRQTCSARVRDIPRPVQEMP